jgi:phosphoglycolate phosphatase-like HAD superfamily hydrolase
LSAVFPPGKLPIVYKLIFWDFDGVIKDSVTVKTQAFVQLFQPYGFEVAARIKEHHEAHGGMSRFEKMPLYLRWIGKDPTEERVQEFCEKFSQMVLQKVIDAPWVPGAEKYIRNNDHRQIFVLLSATPQGEIEQILQELDLRNCFADVCGAPTSKKEGIRRALGRYNLPAQDCLVIGDALVDMDAAKANEVPFLLRRHATNGNVFQQYTGDSLEDFTKL